MLRQELTIEYPHRQQGHSGHRTVPFPYPKIIDRAIGCDIVSESIAHNTIAGAGF
jgi:hypothetical protein